MDAQPAADLTPQRLFWGISPRQLLFHSSLFLLTAAVMLMWWWSGDLGLLNGAMYAGGLLSILFAHEMGHYVAARYYKVDVTLPYFLPGFPPFGTFGAFIKMKAPNIGKEALMVIGAAGPLAGMVIAVPVYALGLSLSELGTLPVLLEPGSTMEFGDSLLTSFFGWIIFGSIPEGYDIMLHPLAYAGWVGFFVTALNLIPIGQLDGGHIGRALFGPRYKWAGRTLFVGLVLCGALLHPVWLVLSIFLTMTGIDHPPMNEAEALPVWGRVMGYACLLIFVLVFIPVPIKIMPLWEMVSLYFSGQL